ncbi:sulfur carrier protein ThiS adenylyltransferase ThiF [Finegoldia magna]|uniref:sulfur carrier protein ThiS adenylyltransferase ThiF n=1 Tax=Finegoldia magna TaxID=1260 RepID=UPI00290FDBB8|nr:sulfur carrier protein ThiS adenylyltransferase ThiF [Finegoldia magna]MDU4731378.1 sulfur carrier protein ThiS adenylyltransferase ThiF [Finegoldia magna]MDU5924206.1 sulfur carrier protein ThiS adenylyltransferase ThiF [Finegoldia magna]
MENIFKRQIPDHTHIFRKSKILILGCGGLGTNLCFMLAKSGIGTIKIVDYDKVEYSNLNRQIYRPTDVGKYKVDAFKEICDEFLPFASISVENIKITENNIDEMTEGYDIVLEALDDEYAKSLVLEHFIGTDKKLISVSGIGGVKKLNMKIKKMNNIVVCGDFETKTDIGLYYPNVMMAACTQAIIALNWLLEENNGR